MREFYIEARLPMVKNDNYSTIIKRILHKSLRYHPVTANSFPLSAVIMRISSSLELCSLPRLDLLFPSCLVAFSITRNSYRWTSKDDVVCDCSIVLRTSLLRDSHQQETPILFSHFSSCSAIGSTYTIVTNLDSLTEHTMSILRVMKP